MRELVLAVAFALLCNGAVAAVTDRAEAWRLINDGQFAPLDAAFNELQREYDRRYDTDVDIERRLSRAFRVFNFADESLDARYTAWVKAYPDSYAASLARGEYLLALAWKRRGHEFGDKIAPRQWAEMHKAAAAALAELTRSLGLASRPVLSYELLIELSMMMSAGNRDDLLKAARLVDPQTYYPSRAHLNALKPQWGGSLARMRAFVDDYRKLGAPAWKTDCLAAQVADMEASDREKPTPAAKLAALTRAIDLCPQSSRYDARAYHYQVTGQHALAIQDYRAALSRDAGDTYARSTLGMLLVEHGPVDEGVALCRAAAEALDANGFHCLAYAYRFGKGVAQDVPETLRWLERAAAAGHRTALHDLGGFFWRGEGVPQNRGRAIELWRAASAKGYPPATTQLQSLGLKP